MARDWTITGDYVEACNCDVACQCIWLEPPDDDACTASLVWTLTGAVPLVVTAVIPIAAIANGNSALLFGGTLTLLSVYQLSPYKHRCLKYCRTPLGFLMEYHQPGIRGAARMSFRFAVFCVGC